MPGGMKMPEARVIRPCVRDMYLWRMDPLARRRYYRILCMGSSPGLQAPRIVDGPYCMTRPVAIEARGGRAKTGQLRAGRQIVIGSISCQIDKRPSESGADCGSRRERVGSRHGEAQERRSQRSSGLGGFDS